MRAFYSANLQTFLQQSNNEILGILTDNNTFDLTDLQRNTWKVEISKLKEAFATDFAPTDKIMFEYTIPRMGKRIDAVFITHNLVFLLEFKIGTNEYHNYDRDQVLDYALDLKNFHKESHNKRLVPILICSQAQDYNNHIISYPDKIIKPLFCNFDTLKQTILSVIRDYPTEQLLDADLWENSSYAPTPTIIEAAQALYANHNVQEISHSDAGAYNLSSTSNKINDIIDYSKQHHKKSICFITGVPGAGKTLAGLNIANLRHQFEENEHAVFLSGNMPLVEVLQEALAEDENARVGTKKKVALQKAKSFIQIIHHYRDAYVNNDDIPTEKVVIFDEAQRAWTLEQIAKFMAQKKGIINFQFSEPEFLISTLDRHNDWAVLICLIGGGQEINTGEAGLIEWFDSLKRSFTHWDVYVSNMITDSEYSRGYQLNYLTKGLNVKVEEKLHLPTSIRSFRSENVSNFIKCLLDVNKYEATKLLKELKKYPIKITRNLQTAKSWIKSQARGTERYGLMASSKALRLKAEGIFVKNDISASKYFLADKDDVQSSYFLEDCATEFAVQGLELDWSIVAWDADFKNNGKGWSYHNFRGSKWQNINSEENKMYLKNTYRVLLTRARQGMVIFVPKGNNDDKTRLSEYYDSTYNYLKQLGIDEI